MSYFLRKECQTTKDLKRCWYEKKCSEYKMPEFKSNLLFDVKCSSWDNSLILFLSVGNNGESYTMEQE